MHQPHPGLTAEVNAAIIKSELLGGVWVLDHPDYVNDDVKAQPVLPVGHSLKVQTRHTLYLIEKRADGFYISGHIRYCPVPTKCSIHGSTWGGSMLKMGFVGRDMNLEFSINGKTIVTSTIQEVEEMLPA